MFPNPFTEVQVQFKFRIVCALPKIKVNSENPNSSFQKLCEKWWDTKKKKKKRCWGFASRAGSRFAQAADTPLNVFTQCCGDAPSDTLSRTT